MRFIIPFLLYSSLIYAHFLRTEDIYDDDGLTFHKNEEESFNLTLPRDETEEEDYTLTLPREETEDNETIKNSTLARNECKSVSKHLYIHLLLENNIDVSEVEVNDFDVAILYDE